jgi:hypothetical protein
MHERVVLVQAVQFKALKSTSHRELSIDRQTVTIIDLSHVTTTLGKTAVRAQYRQ